MDTSVLRQLHSRALKQFKEEEFINCPTDVCHARNTNYFIDQRVRHLR